MPSAPSALGNIVSLGGPLPEGSPPTSYAAYSVLDGQKGAVWSFMGLTALRTLIIFPGLLVAGIRGKRLIYGSMAASAAISLSALGYVFAYKRKAAAMAQQAPVADAQQPIDTTAESSSST